MDKNVLAIGALGGSGTRVVAQIIQRLGYYIGDELNPAYDNLIFTLLFKNPDWYKAANQATVARRIRAFWHYMSNDHLTKEVFDCIDGAASQSNAFYFYDAAFKHRLEEKLHLPTHTRNNWAWKEPNTQIYAQQLLEHDPNIKYIHVVRHGLDMAFSSNKKQLKNWGFRFNIDLSGEDSDNDLARKQLAYWIESTKNILALKKRFEDRVLIVNHTRLCETPELEIGSIVEFLQLNVCESHLREVAKMPRLPKTTQRFTQHNIGMFNSAAVDFVHAMDFRI